MNVEQFDKLSPEKQWAYILENKQNVKMLSLDNDQTQVVLKTFGNDACGEQEWTEMKEDIGDRDGVFILLKILGIKHEGV